MIIFNEANKLIENGEIEESFSKKEESFYLIKSKTSKILDKYSFRIYLWATSWYSQCGCRVGIMNKPCGLCKHSIAGIVKEFLKVNGLKLAKKSEN